jgi:hypothetical protein
MSQAESSTIPAIVETVRIVNVDIDRWSVDAVSEHGNKHFFDIQVASPYFHFMNGEGIYTVPEVGALAWVCSPSSGPRSAPFIMGFQAPHDEDNDSFQCGRQSFVPGDIVLRTRDENFIIIRRGGVVQIGATPTAQRMYIPVQNMIRDFCENYELNAFGGELTWITERDEKTTDGSALTKLSILAKQKADDPKHIAELTIGSHGEDDSVTMKLLVWSDGTKEREAQVMLQVTNEGDVTWDVENDVTMNISGEMRTVVEKDISTETKASWLLSASENVDIYASKELKVECDDSTLKAKSHVVDSSDIKLGGSGATEAAVLGDMLVSTLDKMCIVISALVCTAPGAPVGGATAISAVQGTLSTILAQSVKVK